MVPAPCSLLLASVASASFCDELTSVAATLHWTAVPGAQLYELQYDVPGGGTASITAEAEDCHARIEDLQPLTHYTFRVRASTVNEVSGWQPWGAGMNCTTRGTPDGAVSAVRTLRSSNSSSVAPPGEVTLGWQPPASGASPWYIVRVGSGAGAQAANVTAPPHTMRGLQPGALAQATVTTALGVASDRVTLRVPGVGSRWLTMYRISELQNAGDQEVRFRALLLLPLMPLCCSPPLTLFAALPAFLPSFSHSWKVDFLSNHDSGSDAGDAAFVTAVGGSGHFVTNYNESVITQYCVEMLLEPFADYLSCNRPDNATAAAPGEAPDAAPGVRVEPNMTYECVCNNLIDRVIGHQDYTSACGVSPPHTHGGGACNCSAASLARSAMHVGTMPVFLPWMCHGFGSKGNGTCDVNIPFGAWYSTPTAGQCPEGAPLGTPTASGWPCTWRRLPEARVLRGYQLLEQGWNASDPGHGNTSVAQFESNLGVWRAAFAAITPRPCGE